MSRTVASCAVLLGALLLATPTLLLEVSGLAVTKDHNVLTYFLVDCPTGWAAVSNDDNYAGRVIVAASNGGQSGDTFLTPNTAANQNPTHTHATWGMSINFQPSQTKPVCTPQFSIAAISQTYQWTHATSGTTQSGPTSGIYPSITLNLCQFTSTTNMYLPTGIVFFRASTQCSNMGADQLSTADGRLLVFGSSTRTLSSAVTSQAPQLAQNAPIGAHTHDLNTNYPFSPRTQSIKAQSSGACTGGSTNLVSYGTSYSWSQAAPLSSASLNIPYVRLMVCVSPNTAGSTNALPHPDAIFFASTAACPTNFIDATTRTDSPDPINRPYSNLAGRIVWNRYRSVGTTGVAFGATSPFPLATSNSITTTTVPHAHTLSVPNFNFSASGCNPSLSVTCPGSMVDATQGYSLSRDSSIENNPSQGLIPFSVLRGCSAMRLATNTPTTSPSTSKPSQSPSRAPSTSKPSESPSRAPTTSKPSESPSRAPSTSTPSESPSRAPTTSKPSESPSRAPSTSKPSESPSRAPTTSKPSESPSRAPSTSKPSESPSKAPTTPKPSVSPSKMPTTAKPSQSPSKAPSTPRPSYAPSATPTTSRPSRTPSRAPSTPQPSRDPTRRPTTKPTQSPTVFIDVGCRPQNRMKIGPCGRRMAQCLRKRIRMKWGGTGCRTSAGALVGDGGCQCSGYCGYSCSSACTADSECIWSGGKCLVRATNLPGVFIPQCKPF